MLPRIFYGENTLKFYLKTQFKIRDKLEKINQHIKSKLPLGRWTMDYFSLDRDVPKFLTNISYIIKKLDE